jgi:hypothetical protein
MSNIKTVAQFCDDLKRTAEELRAMSAELTAMFSGNADTPPFDIVPQADKPAPRTKSEPKPKPVTLETVRAALAEKSRAGHTAEVRELLKKHGAEKLSAIDPAEYAALLAEAEAL